MNVERRHPSAAVRCFYVAYKRLYSKDVIFLNMLLILIRVIKLYKEFKCINFLCR